MLTSFREALASTFLEIAEENPSVMVLTPDLARALRIEKFVEDYSGQYISTGISEANTIGVAAGLAASGYTPIIAGFSMFIAEKPFELIRNIIAYPNLNVKFIATHGGICVGQDGATHQAAEDIAMLRTLPNFTVLTACDVAQTQAAIRAAIQHEGPVYVRLGRDKASEVYANGCEVKIGKSDVLADGSDVAIIAAGTLVANALAAAQKLKEDGISAAVINLYSIKPFDQETVLKYAQKCGRIVAAEDHSKFGGIGGTIAEYLSNVHPTRMEYVGLGDVFGESGRQEELYEKYGLDAPSIIAAVKRVCKKS